LEEEVLVHQLVLRLLFRFQPQHWPQALLALAQQLLRQVEEEDLAELFAAAKREGAECLVTTEKDAVRIAETRACPLPLFYLRLEIDIIRGAADFEEAVGRICFPRDGTR
jgi:hypothetical protein